MKIRNAVVNMKNGKSIEIRQDTVAIVCEGEVKINRLDPLGDQKFDYDTVYLTVNEIIELADILKSSQ